MYPADELTRLAQHKESLLRRSESLRANCVVNGQQAVKPIVAGEKLLILLRRIAPFLSPLVILLSKRAPTSRLGSFASALKWGPQLWKFAKALFPK